MRDFRSDDRSRDRRDSSPRRSFGGRDSGRAPMFDAVCDECGKNCQVPFRPSGEKPIYCSECFESKGGRDRNDSPRRSFGGRDSGRPQSNVSDRSISQFVEKVDALNKKLDRIIDLLSSVEGKKTKPAEEKPKKEEVGKSPEKAKAKTKAKKESK